MAACHPLVAPAPADPSLVRQARLLRIEDTRRDEPLSLDSLLGTRDAPGRALTVHDVVTLAPATASTPSASTVSCPDVCVQGGDPRGDGKGGPGYAIRDEMNRRRYLRGTPGMALSGPNTGGSQFFVTHSPQPHLDGGYTVFGQLLRGDHVLDRIVQGDRIVRVTVR